MPRKHTFVTQLLRAYHGLEDNRLSHFQLPTIRQATYLCHVGLGPIAFKVYGDALRDSDPEVYGVLLSSDLTTRAIYRQMENATIEVLKRLTDSGVVPTILKGISTAYEFYSPRHLRLMGDVDILVKHSDVHVTMTTLAELGYEVADNDWKRYQEKAHHHLPEARNPKTGVTVEVHTGLFVPGEPLAKESVFQLDCLEAQAVEVDYNRVPAERFAPEFQLIYTIAHWGMDGNWAVNLTSINDTIHILRRHSSTLDWSMLAEWMASSPWTYPNIAALLHYLNEADLVISSSRVEEAFAEVEAQLQPRTLNTLMWLIHNYPFNAPEKIRDDYARWRASALWQELTKPHSRDSRLPYSFLSVAFRSLHHGRYNPVGWLLSLYRHITVLFQNSRA